MERSSQAVSTASSTSRAATARRAAELQAASAFSAPRWLESSPLWPAASKVAPRQRAAGAIASIESRIDIATLAADQAEQLDVNDSEVVVETQAPMPLRTFGETAPRLVVVVDRRRTDRGILLVTRGGLATESLGPAKCLDRQRRYRVATPTVGEVQPLRLAHCRHLPSEPLDSRELGAWRVATSGRPAVVGLAIVSSAALYRYSRYADDARVPCGRRCAVDRATALGGIESDGRRFGLSGPSARTRAAHRLPGEQHVDDAALAR